ncbi:MAG: serine/threonine-protein phosphatase [Bacteroidetes bacterium]|nr:MAG: serine/threonine-protein phosphatase [Bacteroidota bacterium]
MSASGFSNQKKIRLLAIEPRESIQALIKEACRNFGFLCETLSDSGGAQALLSKRFYSFILYNTQAVHGRNSTFLGNLRNIRGYEKVPVIALSSDTGPEKTAELLDDGCHAVLPETTSVKVIHSYLNLFLRRDLYGQFAETEFLRKDLNQKKGEIILCSTSKEILDIPTQDLNAITHVVTNENELFHLLYAGNIWMVLVGLQARWALNIVGRLKNDPALDIQLILLRNSNVLDASVIEFFNQGGNDLMSVNKPAFILSRQINSRLEREFYFKDKYVSALKSAANKLPIRSEERMNLHAEPWLVDTLHIPHKEVPGGDFYEIINLPDNSKVLILGDVMGKEWGAWFFSLAYMAYIRSSIRLMVTQYEWDMQKVMEELNDVMLRDFKLAEVFTTLTMVYLPEGKEELHLASASGLPLIHYKKESDDFDEIKVSGPLLGLKEEARYEVKKLKLNTGDMLWLFTDGYLEEKSPNALKTLEECLRKEGPSSSLQMLDKELEAQRFSQRYEDDRTLIRIVV